MSRAGSILHRCMRTVTRPDLCPCVLPFSVRVSHPQGSTERPFSVRVSRPVLTIRCALCLISFYRKCQEAGCAKQPTFGGRDDMVIRFCAVHRRPGDADLVHARCRKSDCLKVAVFGFQGGSPQVCYQHREDCMVNINVLVRNVRADSFPFIKGVVGSEGSHFTPSLTRGDACMSSPLITTLRGWDGANTQVEVASTLTTSLHGRGQAHIPPLLVQAHQRQHFMGVSNQRMIATSSTV